jgi:hypothetical protein
VSPGRCSLAVCGRDGAAQLTDADGNKHWFCARHVPEYIAMGYKPADAAPGQQALDTSG